jgi:hypothetical protein
VPVSNYQLPVWARERAVNCVLSKFKIPMALRIKERNDDRLYRHMETSRVKLVVNPWRCGDQPLEAGRLVSPYSLVMLYIELQIFNVVEVFNIQCQPLTSLRLHEHNAQFSLNALARQQVDVPLGATHFFLRELY